MQVLIAHLSDIHLKDRANAILHKVEQLAAAIRSDATAVEAVFIVVTGDLASRGKEQEYAEAKKLLLRLKMLIMESSKRAEIVILPGNHDCSFDRDTTLRQALLAGNTGALREVGGSDVEIIHTCVSVQNDFFAFLTDMAPQLETPHGKSFLNYEQTFNVNGREIVFTCYNTAWLSQIKERQGSLLYPEKLLADAAKATALAVGLFHHPYNWLEADNARAFRKHVEQTSDIVLTGHEHDSLAYSKAVTTGEEVAYVEGGVLQSDTSSGSSFNLIHVDLDSNRWRPTQYDWSTGDKIYLPRRKSEWRDFRRNSFLRRHEFISTAEHEAFLSDAGAAFTHPRVRVVRLDDIFVYPAVDDYAVDAKSSQLIDGDRLLTYVLDHSRVVISGQERSGKTSLAKMVYKAFRGESLVPILVSGDLLRSAKADDLVRVIDRQFTSQYNEALLERFHQLPLGSRVLIIDDFHRTTLNRSGRNLVVDFMARYFERIVILVDDIFHLNDLALGDDQASALFEFRHAMLREFGHARRSTLIERWYSLGADHSISEEEIAGNIAHAERTVDTLLGRNIVPSYPIFILTFLQSLESRIPLNTAAGSYGYIYEVLITAALARNDRAITLDTQYTYISRLAYHLFRTGTRVLSEDNLHTLSQEYFDRYKIRLVTSEIIRDLQDSSILQKTSDGYRFRYRYLYYYFVARYIQENLASPHEGPDLRRTVRELTTRVYNEDAANILIFFIYLTKDEDVINAMLSNARAIFADQPPCDMDTHIRFITNSKAAPPTLAYYESDPKENKQKYLKQLDDAEETSRDEGDEQPETEIDPQIAEVLKLNAAVKTVQIMGQILRNFPGSLRGEIKLEIARECYLLGLRTLQVMLAGLNLGSEFLKGLFKDFLRTKRSITDETELEKRADQFWFYLSFAVGLYAVQTISSAVGSEKLRETYKEVISDNETPAFSLVDIAIKLVHFRPIPRTEILELHKRLSDNLYASMILKQLVIDFFYLYPVDYKTRQKICQVLGIEIRPRALDRESKK